MVQTRGDINRLHAPSYDIDNTNQGLELVIPPDPSHLTNDLYPPLTRDGIIFTTEHSCPIDRRYFSQPCSASIIFSAWAALEILNLLFGLYSPWYF